MKSILTKFGLLALLATPMLAQTREKVLEPAEFNFDFRRDGTTSEKAIVVDPGLNLSLCVTQGNLKINGGERNELRVFIRNGASFDFKPQERSPDGTPTSVIVNGLVAGKGMKGPPNECIWGDNIEIDVPRSSIVNVKGYETATAIDSVRKVRIKVIGGDITARNIAEGVSISAGQGDITVEGSRGSMLLDSTTGNIVVFEGAPRETGDVFKAKTNGGTVSLQQVDYRQVEVSSISGSVMFAGKVLSGASYAFSTSNGSIRLAIPADSAGRIAASYGFGAFNSEIPVEVQTENVSPGSMKSINALFGKKGDALLKLTTSHGSISIRKQ